MSNYDDLFENQQPQNRSSGEDKPFDKEAWAKTKQQERAELFDLADTTAAAIGEEGGELFQIYLDVQSRFDRYSVTNVLLIMSQYAQATQLRTFEGWKAKGVNILKGEHHIKILEPGEEYRREDGSVGTAWKVRRVFDISQTYERGKSKPAPKVEERTLLKALIHHAPVPIQAVDELDGRMGAFYDHAQGTIFVRRGMEAADIFRCLSTELAHAELAAQNPDYERQDAAFQTYCVSYLLCKKYGVDVSGYSFQQLPDSFREADPQQIREQLTEIADTAKQISQRMSRMLEQSKPAKAKGQER